MKPFCTILFLFLGLGALPQLTYQQLVVQYDSAITYQQLQLIPITRKMPGPGSGPMLSLGKALEQGLVKVSERGSISTENVHWLRINNLTQIPIYIASGEIITGGRQDRMISRDTVLVPTGHDQYVAVMCVEEDRWSEKEKKFAYFNYANPRLRRVVDQSRNQVLIWREIFDQLDSSKIKSPTLAYAGQRNDKKLNQLQEEYLNYFKSRIRKTDSTWVGFVLVSGSQVLGCDVFDSHALFKDQLEPLLNGFIEQAITRGADPMLPREQIKKYMDQLLSSEESQDAYVKKNGKQFRYQGRVIHLTGYSE